MMRTLAPTVFYLLSLATPALAHTVATGPLPLGDGKISTSPQRGYVYSCQTHFHGGGAAHNGPWIVGDVWYPNRKIAVEGQVSWPDSRISITTAGQSLVISANGLPQNKTGIFPIAYTDPAYAYDHNPNTISTQDIQLTLPSDPQMAPAPSCVNMGLIGITTTGVALFNALDAQGRDAAAHEVQDSCDGHPQQQGEYHFHSWSPCLPDPEGDKGHASGLIGYALDGFGIYGPRGDGGKLLADADLDACHGRTSPVMWHGKLQNIYHYNFTLEYPYIIGCFMGTPVHTAQHMGRDGGRQMQQRRFRRPPPFMGRPPRGMRPPPPATEGMAP